jgi:hypothetical protein
LDDCEGFPVLVRRNKKMLQEKDVSDQHVVYGRMTYAESGQAAAGVRVTALDVNQFADEKLGKAITDKDGQFSITYDIAPFRDLSDPIPDIYLLVHNKDDYLLANTKGSVVLDAGPELEINLELPGSEIDPPATRTQFTKLVLSNPNYFGNMPESGFEPVEPMSGNTAYEELTCIGLNPEANRLEAVVDIKRHYGYHTGPCGVGSPEYVRFFVERSGSWHDVGLVSFTSYNISGSALPLSYSVGIELNEIRQYCTDENLVKVRGILSWNQEPPAGDPNWTPPWGNVVDSTVQIAALPLPEVSIGQLIADKQLIVKSNVLANLDLQQKLQPAAPKAMSYGQLKEAYADKDVPGHRFGFPEALALTQGALGSQAFSPQPLSETAIAESASAPAIPAPGQSSLVAGQELAEILEELALTSGDTTFEELVCVGYNPHTRTLGGVISIKRSYGYSSGLCGSGSTEYVNFWAYYNGGWQPLGGAQVQVHDLAGVGGGDTVQYAVFRGVNLPEYLCKDVTGLKLRAILSWEDPPTGAGFVPRWGNVVNTFIQPPIGEPEVGEDHRVRLMRIGRVTINGISNVTGRATNTAPGVYVAGDCQGNDSPFGGNIHIEGDFTNKPDVFDPITGDVLPGTYPLRYQVFVNKVGGPSVSTQLTNSFTIAVFPKNAYSPEVKTQAVQNIGGADYYTYMESNSQAVNPRTLAVWRAGGLEEGLYHIEVKCFSRDGSSYVLEDSQGQNVYVYNGYPHTELLPGGGSFTAHRPEVHMQITSPGGDCGNFVVGSTIEGTYSVTDHFFGKLRARVVPITVGGVPQPANPVEIYDSAVLQPNPVVFQQTAQADTGGLSGTWKLKTKGMTPCGYTIQLWSRDRALVGNSCYGHYNETGVGFCLRPLA